MDAGGGRSAHMSMMVGDTELFRCGCTPSVVLFSVQYYVTEKTTTDACLKLLLTVISSMQGKEEGEGEEEEGGNPAPIAPVSNSNPKDKNNVYLLFQERGILSFLTPIKLTPIKHTHYYTHSLLSS